jgi:anthranilate phosphoribosyltransferase
MIFFGDDGLDELTTTTTSVVYELTDDRLHSYPLDPADFGIARAEPSQLVGGDAATNAKLLRAVLRGDEGPHRDLALLNAAAALMVAGIAGDFPAGIAAARASIDSGAGDRALDTMARVSTAEAVTEAAATEKGA